MAYFSNGSESADYEETWCDKCLHGGNNCAVWLAHELKNYEDCNDEGSILHVLIPKDGINNARCTMFVDRGLLSNLAIQKYESDQAALSKGNG